MLHIIFAPFFVAEFLGFMGLFPVFLIVQGHLFPISYSLLMQTVFAGWSKFVPRCFARVELNKEEVGLTNTTSFLFFFILKNMFYSFRHYYKASLCSLSFKLG